MDRLFAYGSLMFSAVMATVAAGRFEGRPAVLPGFARYALRGESYPGLVPEAGSHTQGVVYSGLGPDHLERLDRFEGEWYERRRVDIRVSCGSDLTAFVYVLRPAQRRRLAGTGWDAEHFARTHLAAFVAEYGGFGRL